MHANQLFITTHNKWKLDKNEKNKNRQELMYLYLTKQDSIVPEILIL
jgi:hypothetical protein